MCCVCVLVIFISLYSHVLHSEILRCSAELFIRVIMQKTLLLCLSCQEDLPVRRVGFGINSLHVSILF